MMVALLLVGSATLTMAQTLKFNSEGRFKIMQITDVHYNGSAASVAALPVIDRLLTAEKPDLIVLTGDIIWGPPAKENLLSVLNRIAKHHIPFVYEFGNRKEPL